MSLVEAAAKSVSWGAILERAQRSNVRVDHNADDVPALRSCDILVTDISTRALIFMLLDKPVVLYLPGYKPSDVIEEKRYELLRGGAHIVDNPSQLSDVVERLLRDGDNLSEDRSRIAKKCYSHIGNATGEMMSMIKEQVNKNP